METRQLRARPACFRILGLPEHWFHLGAGLLLALAFATVPLLGLIGWYFTALVHEMGHAAAAWLVGVPAIPTLGITVEAATIHGTQLVPLAVLIGSIALVTAWRLEVVATRIVACALLCIIYPLVAFTAAREIWQLAAGHLGELILAAVFLARALSGGFTQSRLERTLYATLGWFVLGSNLALTIGLASDAAKRVAYSGSGSYGLRNDYLRLADQLGWRVESIATLMTVLALLVVPMIAGLWYVQRSTRPRSWRPAEV